MTEEEKLEAWERFNSTAQVGTAHKQQFLDALTFDDEIDRLREENNSFRDELMSLEDSRFNRK